MKIRTETKSFVEHYPQFRALADEQLKVIWYHDEIKLEKDIHDILTNMSEAERHGVITTLRLFTLYELFAGKEHWGGAMMRRYPRPEIMAMCSVFGAFELGIHQKFYARINELLNLNTDEFYLSYIDDPILNDRISFVDDLINNIETEEDMIVSTGAFSFVEGAVLYSSFAFLKHFQSQGKNKLLNMVRGINFSAIDENLHAIGGAMLFKEHLKESGLPSEPIYETLKSIANIILEHEERVIDMIFEKGEISGITKEQLKEFVKHRLNKCLLELGIEPQYKIEDSSISEWFYNGINNYQFVDFFSGIGREYQRNYNETEFTWE